MSEDTVSNEARFSVAVFPGDGIGHEVMDSALRVLAAVQRKAGGFALDYTRCEASADLYRRTGEALPQAEIEVARNADAILLGAAGLPEVTAQDVQAQYMEMRRAGVPMLLKNTWPLDNGLSAECQTLRLPLSDGGHGIGKIVAATAFLRHADEFRRMNGGG